MPKRDFQVDGILKIAEERLTEFQDALATFVESFDATFGGAEWTPLNDKGDVDVAYQRKMADEEWAGMSEYIPHSDGDDPENDLPSVPDWDDMHFGNDR